jgi:hypothetical protein
VLRSLSLYSTLVLAFGCGGQSKPEPAPAPQVVVDPGPAPPPTIQTVTDTVRIKDPELQRKVDRLELQLAESDARIEELESRLDAARQDVVRTLGRSQGTASRAAAASGIAEAELATQSPRGASAADITQAKKLLRLGTDAFNEGNFAGALYLTEQAKALVAPTRRAAASDLPPRAGEKTFASPVGFKAAKRASVREGPGTDFKLLFTVKAGTRLTGFSYTDQWVRVTDESGRGGWVAKELLARP